MHINKKKQYLNRLLSDVMKLITKRVTKKLFLTMATNITRKEHKNHKENYRRVKQKLICTK